MFLSHVRYVCIYAYMNVCMHVCTKSFLNTTTNSLCVRAHLANKADSDSDIMCKNASEQYFMIHLNAIHIIAFFYTTVML